MSWESCLVAVYSPDGPAEDAVRRLEQRGFPAGQVHLIGRARQDGSPTSGSITPEAAAKAPAPVQESAAGVFGRLLGAAAVLIPGVGPRLLADRAALALLDALDRCVDDVALIAWRRWLQFVGVPTEHAAAYAERLRARSCLVVALGSAQEEAGAEAVLRRTEPGQLDVFRGSAPTTGVHSDNLRAW
jgi:hypothetical protein